MKPYTNTLAIDHKHKPIPYGGTGQFREDGDANYGFRYVKNNESLLAQIPELQRDLVLLELVRAINATETGLFSVGCVSGPVKDQDGLRQTGYVEFSINSRVAIADARSYFPIFFRFDQLLHEGNFSVPMSYAWELQPATFTEVGVSGFTCSIFLNTHYSLCQTEAASRWSQALGVLGYYLRSIPAEHSDFLYPQ